MHPTGISFKSTVVIIPYINDFDCGITSYIRKISKTGENEETSEVGPGIHVAVHDKGMLGIDSGNSNCSGVEK